MRQDCIHFYDKIVWDRTASIFWQDGMRQDCIHFYDKIVWDRTASIFMTRWHETGLHPFLWQDCMRQDCIHFYDKMAWDRTASILMTRLYETGLHPFLWQDGMRQDCIHFYDKIVWDRHSSIFMTSQHKTGTHPFYIGMYIHINTHIYVHIYTSQKECLHIFSGVMLNFGCLTPIIMNSVCLSLSGTMFLFVDLVTCDIETQVTVSFGVRYPELVEIPLLNGGTHHPTYGQKSLPFSPSSIFFGKLLTTYP